MELKENTVIVVLGASGDLAKKKTVRHRGRRASATTAANELFQFPALFGLVRRYVQTPSVSRRLTMAAVPESVPAQGHPDRWLRPD